MHANMAAMSSITLSFLFTLSLLTISPHSSPLVGVNADEALIEKMCSTTEAKQTCANCLRSDPKSDKLDARGLGKVSVHCANDDVVDLGNFLKQAHDEVTDPNMKSLLQDCSTQVETARNNFGGLYKNIDSGNFLTAKISIGFEIIPHLDQCMDLYSKHPELKFPEGFLARVGGASIDCNIVVAILDILDS